MIVAPRRTPPRGTAAGGSCVATTANLRDHEEEERGQRLPLVAHQAAHLGVRLESPGAATRAARPTRPRRILAARAPSSERRGRRGERRRRRAAEGAGRGRRGGRRPRRRLRASRDGKHRGRRRPVSARRSATAIFADSAPRGRAQQGFSAMFLAATPSFVGSSTASAGSHHGGRDRRPRNPRGPNFVCWNLDASRNGEFLGATSRHPAARRPRRGSRPPSGATRRRATRSSASAARATTTCATSLACSARRGQIHECMNQSSWTDLLGFADAADARMIVGLSMNESRPAFPRSSTGSDCARSTSSSSAGECYSNAAQPHWRRRLPPANAPALAARRAPASIHLHHRCSTGLPTPRPMGGRPPRRWARVPFP